MRDGIDHCKYHNEEKQDGKDCLLGLNTTLYPTMNLRSTNIQLGCEAAHLHTLCSLLNSCKQQAPRLCVLASWLKKPLQAQWSRVLLCLSAERN